MPAVDQAQRAEFLNAITMAKAAMAQARSDRAELGGKKRAIRARIAEARLMGDEAAMKTQIDSAKQDMLVFQEEVKALGDKKRDIRQQISVARQGLASLRRAR